MEPDSHVFGQWRFDTATGDLFDGKDTTRLEPQVGKLLDYFLTHQDTLISRDELMAEVWGNRVVSDHAVNRCISILRNTLSPEDKNAHIETVPRRGFISHFPPPVEAPTVTAPSPRRTVLLVLLALALMAAIGVYVAIPDDVTKLAPADSPAGPHEPRSTELPVVAVLPFITSGMSGDSEFFANGVHDDLLTRLAQLQSLRVISRTSVYEYRDSHRNIREIGHELGADAILEGSVQQVGTQIRINAQLIDAGTDRHLWARQYDRELSPALMFAVQTEIALAVAAALEATLTEQDTRQLAMLPTENMAAYRAYHEAMEVRISGGPLDPAYMAALERAVALDPDFVAALAALAGALSFANFSGHDPASIQRAEQILERIRSLAPGSADYLIAQTYYTYYVLKDYQRALGLINEAQALRPSDAQVLDLKAWIQRRLGDYDGVIATRRLAHTIDPRNTVWNVNVVTSLLITHRYDEALEEIENSPNQSYRLSELRSLLRLREHRDPARRLRDLAVLQREFNVVADPRDLWDAHIAIRDFAGAAAILDSPQASQLADDRWPVDAFGGLELTQILTWWFLQAQDHLDPLLDDLRARLQRNREPGGGSSDVSESLAMAVVTAAAENRPETERLVRFWLRESTADLAELAVLRHHACRALGMVAATAAAVDCIRRGLVEPSMIMPFVEPYLPYYDGIREEPEFVRLLADTQGAQTE